MSQCSAAQWNTMATIFLRLDQVRLLQPQTFLKKDVQHSLVEAGKAQPVDGQFVIDLDDSELEKMSSTPGGSKQNVVVTWGGLMCSETPLQNTVGDRWWVTVGKEVQWRPGYHARRIIHCQQCNDTHTKDFLLFCPGTWRCSFSACNTF